MKTALFNLVESKVSKFRQTVGLSDCEAINIKSLLLKLNVLTMYRSLSETFSGMSLRGGDKRFMLINSNHPRCRQHFTIAHELYHLFIEEDTMPHNSSVRGRKSESEQCADAFAQLLLMPADGVRQLIPEQELKVGTVSLGTVIRIEHYFSVSHAATLHRLYDLKLIDRDTHDKFLKLPIVRMARAYGYDTQLYLPGNKGLVIGDFGEKARKLFDEEKISEGHYLELLHKIGINDEED